MGLGNRRQGGNYLKVSYGAIRKICEATTPNAERRELKDGSSVYELVWDELTGTLIGITAKHHEEYGWTWTLHIQDEGEVYHVQVQEDSRYGSALLKKIPLLGIGKQYKVAPYDFIQKGDTKSKVGVSITDLDTGEKVQSHFQRFTKDGDRWTVENLNGYPDFTGDSTDKDDLKFYYKKATKAMRAVCLNYIHEPTAVRANADSPVPSSPPELEPNDNDALPF